jgi:hypothetical protein
MTNVAMRFIIGAAIVGGFVAGSFGVAQAQVVVSGKNGTCPTDAACLPFTWNGSSYPTPVDTGFNVSNGYCWLSGFDLGSQYTQHSTFVQDQIYVYIDSRGHWLLSGAGKDQKTAPSPNSWGQAYCIDLVASGQDLFYPSNGPVVQWACPSPNDHNVGGSCYTSTNGVAALAKNFNTWTGLPNFTVDAWTNTFAGIMGIGYDGNDGTNANIRFNVLPYDKNNPNQYTTINEYAELPISNVGTQTGDSNTHVAWGAIWPENNDHWFCGLSSSNTNSCYGAAPPIVRAGTHGDSGPQVLRDTWGDPLTANSLYYENYVCVLNHFETSGANGEVSAKLSVDQYSQWNLEVTGPFYTQMNLDPAAAAFCFPYPYYLPSP